MLGYLPILLVSFMVLVPPGVDDVVARLRAVAEDAVGERFPNDAYRLEIRVKRVGGDIPVQRPLRVAFPLDDGLPRGYTQVEVWSRRSTERWEKTGWALLYVAHFDSVLVARSDLAADDEVTMDDVRAAWVETTSFSGRPLRPADLRHLLEQGSVFMERPVREGRFLRKSHVRPAYAVQTGETVIMRYRRGGLIFDLTCKAREPGYVEDLIRVYSPDTGRIYRARLTGTGTAEWIETL